MLNTIRVIDIDCNIQKDYFSFNKQACISLFAADTEHNKTQDTFPGEPITKLSLVLEGVNLLEEQTLIKDEYLPIIKELEDMGYVKNTFEYVNYGFNNQMKAFVVNLLF